MKNTAIGILAVLLAFFIGAFVFQKNHDDNTVTVSENAWNRILRTNTIRCGYYVYPPVVYRDPNTNKLSGLSVDMMEKIATRSGLKLEWTEEVNFGNWQLGLQAKRYDMACTPMWPNTAMGRVVYFTQPFFYAAIYAIGRSDDDRFKTLADLNSEAVSVAAQESNEMYFLAEDVFPETKIKTIPANADGNLIGFDVITKKADFLLSDKNFIKELNKSNPGALKVLVDTPVKMMPFTLAVGTGENELLQFVNNATNEIVLTGEIDRLIEKWVPDNNIYIPVAKDWKEQK